MRQFIKKLALILVVMISLDHFLVGAYLNFLPHKEVDKRLEYLINGKINKDIIIVGSSKGARGIIASEIEAKTGMTCYNLSFPGSDVTFHEFITRALLEFNKPPKYVLLTIDGALQFLSNESINFRNDRLYPLVKYSFIKDELIARDEIKWPSLFVNTMCLKKSQLDFRMRKFGLLDTLIECGSMPISFQDPRIDTLYFNDTICDYSTFLALEKENKINSLLELHKNLENKGVKLVLLFPPNLYMYPSGIQERLCELLEDKVQIIEYPESNPIFKSPKLYYDKGHLKSDGALVYTDYVIERLNGDVLNPKN